MNNERYVYIYALSDGRSHKLTVTDKRVLLISLHSWRVINGCRRCLIQEEKVVCNKKDKGRLVSKETHTVDLLEINAYYLYILIDRRNRRKWKDYRFESV